MDEKRFKKSRLKNILTWSDFIRNIIIQTRNKYANFANIFYLQCLDSGSGIFDSNNYYKCGKITESVENLVERYSKSVIH